MTTIELDQRFDSPEEWWQRITSIGGPLAVALAAISEDDVAAIRERALNSAAEFVAADGTAVFPAAVVAAAAPAS